MSKNYIIKKSKFEISKVSYSAFQRYGVKKISLRQRRNSFSDLKNIHLRLIIKENDTSVVNLPLSKDEWGLEPIYEGLDINQTERCLTFFTKS